MKNLKVVLESKTLLVNVKVDVEVGSVKTTCLYQICYYKNIEKGNECKPDIDLIDFEDMTYMGVEVKDWFKLKALHLEMGIDLDKQIRELTLPIVQEYVDNGNSELSKY